MCLILFAYNVHPSYRLILAANRDEFYDRPTAVADFWKTNPDLLAGRDLKEKGTWLGVTREGSFAAVTNYRDPQSWMPDAPTRGKLVSKYLNGRVRPQKYLEKISKDATLYNGFNLLIGDPEELWVYSNRGRAQKLSAGVYGLSNHLLDTRWPKVQRGRKMLKEALNLRGEQLEEALFYMLADRRLPSDGRLPDTGIGLEWERVLSSIFIKSPEYGTRSSTLLLIAKNRRVKFVEKAYNGEKLPWLTSRFSFLQRREKS